MTKDEVISYASLVAMLRSTWWPSGALSDMDSFELEMLTNDAVIRVSMMSTRTRQVHDARSRSFDGPGIVWTSDDIEADWTYVLLTNLHPNETLSTTVDFVHLGLLPTARCRVTDLWSGASLADAHAVLSVPLRPRASALLRLSNCSASEDGSFAGVKTDDVARLASRSEPPPPPPPPPLDRPALSVWAYTAVPDALAFLRRVPPGSTNSSFLDFFFGAGMCGQGDPKPCDPIRRTTFAASQLGVPALYPATEVFFERSASGAMPSAQQALANWTAAKAKLPSSGVLGFFLGVRLLSAASVAREITLDGCRWEQDELGVQNGTSGVGERLRWAADVIKADFPKAIICKQRPCASFSPWISDRL